MYKPGTILRTRDGRLVGNGIITGTGKHEIDGEMRTVHEIITDFGNRLIMTTADAFAAFHLPTKPDPQFDPYADETPEEHIKRWCKDRDARASHRGVGE